jgi:chromosomal replication initiation ATPase DnaA|tara:strand:+ start:135 stop:593 length:459 start_codon:yes stop_codon:yes gene_type:complete
MGSAEDEVITIIKRLAKTIKKVGVKKVVAALDELNTEEGFIEAHKTLIKFVLKETSTSFKVNSEDLKRKNIRGVTVDARSMCFVLLKKHLDLTHSDIALIFGSRNHSMVSNALTAYRDLDYDIRADRKFIEIFKDVDKKVDEQKNILWLKHS